MAAFNLERSKRSNRWHLENHLKPQTAERLLSKRKSDRVRAKTRANINMETTQKSEGIED